MTDVRDVDLVPRSVGGLVTLNLSARLAYWVELIGDPHPDVPPPPVPATVMEEARAALARLAWMDTLATKDQLREWLLPIAGAVGNPPTEGDFDRRLDLLYLASIFVPGCGFNDHTRQEAIETFEFWPSIAQLLNLVRKSMERVVTLRETLKIVAGYGQDAAAPLHSLSSGPHT